MKVLLSIKPKYAQRILSGEKKYEFRKRIFTKNVKSVVIYSSTPEQLVIGEFTIGGIIHDSIETLWLETQRDAGISYEEFEKYFSGKDKGYAIIVSKFKKYSHPHSLSKLNVDTAPQSYRYIV
ncbi:MAG: hypothetical protein K8S56_10405 [Candidatus Cloacimonetes bacterium]|nr:hypothetical protein [Candidatus Cloacimonadota bacterium]